LWDSGLIEGGTDGTCSFTFEEPGTYDTYEYFCGPRKEMGMVGTVTVSGGSARASASASATGSASASAGAETLSDTGGPPLALVAALFLAGSGLVLVGSGLVPFAAVRPQGFIGFIFGGGGGPRPFLPRFFPHGTIGFHGAPRARRSKTIPWPPGAL
jgi:Copper binding proteins, plastocyanin/azurin family